jgi:CRISPR-associated protein Csm1
MLTEAVVRYLLRRLELPITNLLYAGGGHFYVLAPLAAEERLDALQAEVSRKLLDHHGGDLYLALGTTAAKAKDFDRERFSETWRDVSRAMNAAKRQRFGELDEADLLIDRVFGPRGQGGDEDGVCQVCHYDGPVETEREGTPDERRICAFCQSMEALGTDLRAADYLVLGQVPPQDSQRAGYREALRAFGLAVGMTAADGASVLRLPDDVERATLLATRDLPDAVGVARSLASHCGCPVVPGTRYTVNVTPRVSQDDLTSEAFGRYAEGAPDWEIPKAGDVKTFGLMQAQARGVGRLGVLRMDVDDLGDLFKWGMREEATLSRVASLSFALSLFFEGWVGELCRRVNQAGPDKVYAIYSGGDDLFIVGAWDALPGLADRIRRDLTRFAAGNPAVHISGGLTLHGGKYPLYQAAGDAERALEAAKDHERPGAEAHAKDAFHWLGVTVPWEDFEELREEKEALLALVEEHEVDRSLLRTLIKLYGRFSEAVHEHGKPVWGPWMWQAAYTLKRMEDRERDDQAAAGIARIRRRLKDKDFRTIETLGPAARWAELLTRKEQER